MQHRNRKWILVALVLVVTASALHPRVRQRGQLVKRKLFGESQLSWVETFVRLAPWQTQDRFRSLLGFTAPQWARPLDYSTALGPLPRKKHSIFFGPTPNVTRLDCHYSVLQAGHSPHPPHLHDEEEIIIPIHGEVDIIRVDAGASETPRTSRAGAGDLVYHAPNQAHTIRAAGPEPSAYLVFRWSASPRPAGVTLSSSIFDLRDTMAADLTSPESRRKTVLFESPTEQLALLHCHLTTIKPGAGSSPHRNDHDVALVVLSGTIRTLDRTLTAPAVAFHPAGTVHSSSNAGESSAQYLAIEFHKQARN